MPSQPEPGMAAGSAELPPFVSAHQAALQATRRRVYERVQHLTRQGRHGEAHDLWEHYISDATGTDG
jgi:hypothetical protein